MFDTRKLRARGVAVFNAGWGQVANAACAAAAVRLYTELLTKTQFGYVVMAMGGIAFIDGILIMAFNQTLLSLCGQTSGRKEQNTIAAGLALHMVRIIGRIALFALPVTLFLCLLLRRSMTIPEVAAVLSVYIASELLKTSMLSPLVANREYFRYSTWTTVEAATVLTTTALSIKFIGGSVLVYVASLVLGRILSTAIFFASYFRCEYFRNLDVRPARQVEAQAFQYAWPISAMAPLGWAAAYLDRFMLAAVGGAAQTGVYSAAASLVLRPYAIVTSVLSNYFRPRLYTSDEGGVNSETRLRIQNTWITSALGVGLLGTLASAVFGRWVAMLLLAKDYRANAVFLLVAIALSQTFAIMTHGIDNTVLSMGASATLLKTQAALAIATSLLIPLGAMLLGPRGAALGRCGAEAIKFACTFLVSYRIARLPNKSITSSAFAPLDCSGEL